MAVLRYNTTGGIFSIIKDSSAFDYLENNVSFGNSLYSGGQITPIGNGIINNFPVNDIYISTQVNTDNVDYTQGYNNLLEIFPNIAPIRAHIQTTSATNFVYNIDNTNEYTIVINCRYYQNDADLRFSTQAITKGQENVSVSSYAPLGLFTAYIAGSSTASLVYCGMIVLNDDGSAGRSFIIQTEGRSGNISVIGIGVLNANQLHFINTFIGNVQPFTPPPDDPFAPGGGSGPGGGTGNFDNTSDTIPVPGLPSLSVTDTGFLTIFATNSAGLRSLSNYLWSDLFSAIQPGGTMEETVNVLKKIVANPYDAILGCSVVPVSVPVGSSKEVKMYGVLQSGVSLPVASSQYVSVDCGTLNVNEFWGAYLDYSPYTKVTSLYLPYVGVVSVDTDMIMGKALQVIYHVDILSGQCIAYIVIDGSVEFQYQGHCATAIPITSIDYTSTIQSGLSLIGSVTNIVGQAVGGGMTGGAVGALAGGASALASKVPSMASDVMSSKPDIKSGSGIGGMGGMMSVQKPFLIIERPRQSLPVVDDLSQKHWTGYPSNMATSIGSMTGYVEVSRIYVNRMTATASEKREIEQLLNEGVYI